MGLAFKYEKVIVILDALHHKYMKMSKILRRAKIKHIHYSKKKFVLFCENRHTERFILEFQLLYSQRPCVC